MKRCLAIAVLSAMTLAIVPAHAQLTVGDQAPKFTIDKWLHGGPEDLAAGKGKRIYVLDFWASWCVPCIYQMPELDALQRRFAGDNVVVIGVTGPAQRQQLEQVREFLKARPGGVNYTIGWDSSLRMWDTYLTAAGAQGIPYLFVIDRNGRIAWHGHQSPDIGGVVEQLVAGTFDMNRAVARAQNEPKIREKFMAINTAVMMKNWPQVVAQLDDVLRLDPTHEDALMYAYQVRVKELGKDANVRGWIEGFLAEHAASSEALSAMANLLMTIEDPAERLPDLMLRAARNAYRAGKGRNLRATEQYARAAYRVGNLDQAIKLQTEVVQSAPESRRPELTKRLAYYQTCRRLRDTEF